MNWSIGRRLAALLMPALVLSLAAACSTDAARQSVALPAETGPAELVPVDPLATAAAQATAIVQQAQATAMVLQAQTEAQATVQAAGQAAGQPAASDQPAPAAVSAEASATTVATSAATAGEATVEIPIEVLSVGFAGEGGMIQVRFRAPVDVADRWLQGSVYLIDESNGVEYKEIPVMPRIGPLFGKPVRDGQPGYFMLVNAPQPILPGATVTVVLGDHVVEGITVDG